MCSRHKRKITTSPTKCLHSPTNKQQSLRSDRRKTTTTSSVVVAVVVQCGNFIWIDYLRRISTNFAKRSSIVEALIVRWRRLCWARWSSLIYDGGGCRRLEESRILWDRNLLISHVHKAARNSPHKWTVHRNYLSNSFGRLLNNRSRQASTSSKLRLARMKPYQIHQKKS